MSISTTTLNLSAWGLAALTATGLFMASPFTQDPPADLPAPPMEVRCASFFPTRKPPRSSQAASIKDTPWRSSPLHLRHSKEIA